MPIEAYLKPFSAISFQQKYLQLCSEDERRSYGQRHEVASSSETVEAISRESNSGSPQPPPAKKARKHQSSTDLIMKEVKDLFFEMDRDFEERERVRLAEQREYENQLRREASQAREEELAKQMTMLRELQDTQNRFLGEILSRMPAPAPTPYYVPSRHARFQQSTSDNADKHLFNPLPSLQLDVPVEINAQWQQESAPYSPSSELDSSSAKQESPVSSHSWVKQEPEPEVIQWGNMNSEAATDAEQDKSLSSAVASADPSMEGLPSSVMLSITKLQCLLESKQERIEALERQVQDLQEDRKFLRTQIEILTGARLVPVPEVPTASTSVFSEHRSRKRRRKSSSSSCANDESMTDESSSISSEESSSVRKKRRHKKKGKRGCVSQCD
ncbi:uncharacterized protein zgc:174877 isoform X6 [Pseudorasbora parva]|uniref:uncharacterized protein zgc:174877 isoform X6 n=1 Tax=Pseudorasbora parva TaxID=51549 RepID=UPI00351DE3A6